MKEKTLTYAYSSRKLLLTMLIGVSVALIIHIATGNGIIWGFAIPFSTSVGIASMATDVANNKQQESMENE